LSQHLDLAPTLLDLVDVAIPAEYRGRSIRNPAEEVFAENGPWRAVYDKKRKLIFNLETLKEELYRTSDELDRERLPDKKSPLTEKLAWYMQLEAELADPGNEEKSEPWTTEELERLKALGYVD
jgi:arylsulfatase A-like enzyme